MAYGDNTRSGLLLEDDLHVRIKRVRLHDAFSDWLEVRGGVPKGNVLGPMYFFYLHFYKSLIAIDKNCSIENVCKRWSTLNFRYHCVIFGRGYVHVR